MSISVRSEILNFKVEPLANKCVVHFLDYIVARKPIKYIKYNLYIFVCRRKFYRDVEVDNIDCFKVENAREVAGLHHRGVNILLQWLPAKVPTIPS